MSYLFSFEKLEVWQLSKELVKEIYVITKKFPAEEKFGLISQINRAAISVASTIAEGSARTSKKDQAHFTQIAYGSLMEAACQLMIAQELGYLTAKEYSHMKNRIDMIGNKLNALRQYQINGFNRFNSSTIKRFN